MTYHFNVTGEERKKLVKAVSNFLGIKEKYLRVPTCAYQIGSCNVSKTGELSGDNMDEALIAALEEAGFHSEESEVRVEQPAKEPETPEEPLPEEETDENHLTISLPRALFDETSLENLKALIQAKGSLMKQAFQTDNLDLEISDEQIGFPWFSFDDADSVQTFTIFVQKISEMARKQHRISAKEKESKNEKYAFRCFLLRLGFIGDEYKKNRKILLKNFEGSSAFGSQESADRFKEKQEAKKMETRKEEPECLE